MSFLSTIFTNVDDAVRTGEQIVSQTETDVAQFAIEGQRELTDVVQTAERGAVSIVLGAEELLEDTERGLFRTLNNVQGNIGHSWRYTAKNVVGLVDNLQDNVYQVVQDIRTDVSNSIQLFAILVGAGVAIFLISNGSEISKRGMNIGEFSIF